MVLKHEVTNLVFSVPGGCQRINVSPDKTIFLTPDGDQPKRQVDAPLLVFREPNGKSVVCVALEAEASTEASVAGLIGKGHPGLENAWVNRTPRIRIDRLVMVFTSSASSSNASRVLDLEAVRRLPGSTQIDYEFVPFTTAARLKDQVDRMAAKIANVDWSRGFLELNPEFDTRCD